MNKKFNNPFGNSYGNSKDKLVEGKAKSKKVTVKKPSKAKKK